MQVCGCINIHLSPLPSMVKFSRAGFSFCVYFFIVSLLSCFLCCLSFFFNHCSPPSLFKKTTYSPSARMREGSCVCVSPRPSRATTRQTGHSSELSIVVAPELIWRFSYNGFVSKIAIAFPYLRAHGSRPFFIGSFSAFLPYTTLVIARER